MTGRSKRRPINWCKSTSAPPAWRIRYAPYVVIDRSTIQTIIEKNDGKATKVINLIKSIEREAEENSGDPFLVAMADRAKAVQEAFEDRQSTTEEALETLLAEIDQNEKRRKAQAAKGLDGLSYFVLCKLTDEGIPNPDTVCQKIRAAFEELYHWRTSDKVLMELRKRVTFAIYAEVDDLDKVTAFVESLIRTIHRHPA